MIFWGTFFPLISELFTGKKASLAAPWFDRYTTPLAILLVLFTGIGPLFAWRRVSLGAARSGCWSGRRWRRCVAAAALLAFTDAGSRPLALVMFTLAAFALAALVQEFARGAAAYRSLAGGLLRARAPGPVRSQPPPLRRLRGPRGHRRAADRHRRLVELPDQPRPAPAPRPVGERRPLPDHLRQADRRDQPRRAAPHLRVGPHGDQGRQAIRDPRPVPQLLRVGRDPGGGRAGAELLRGPGDERGGAEDHASNDLWTAMQPDLTSLNPIINGADRRLEKLAKGVSPTNVQAGQALGYLQGLAVRTIEKRYLRIPRPPISGSTSTRWSAGSGSAARSRRSVGWSRSGRPPRPGDGASPTSTPPGWPASWAAPEPRAVLACYSA